jgi:hypothetical protein
MVKGEREKREKFASSTRRAVATNVETNETQSKETHFSIRPSERSMRFLFSFMKNSSLWMRTLLLSYL